MTKCIRCNDNRVVWSTGSFGMATASPCPNCNKHGQSVRAETAELEATKVRKSDARKYTR